MTTTATMTTETAGAVEDVAGEPVRRARRTRRTDAPAAQRGRGPRLTGDALVANLAEMVDQLVRENRELKRSLARAGQEQGGLGLGQAAKTLAGLQRRVSRALSPSPATGTRRRRAATTETAAPRPRRKVTDPEVLAVRRQALAKARAARAAKREAAANAQ
jgi:hypothetical protein